MTEFRDYFQCGECENRGFMRIYSFSLRFHTVNFSDDLIYDNRVEEQYQCSSCGKTYSREQIDRSLAEIRRSRRQK